MRRRRPDVLSEGFTGALVEILYAVFLFVLCLVIYAVIIILTG